MDEEDLSRLVFDHADVVDQEARRFRLTRLDFDDLRQAGFIGLLTAAARYDPTRGPFSAYGRLWARKEMQRAIAGSEFSTVVPAEHVGRVVALRRLSEESGTLHALADRVHLSEEITSALLASLTVELPAGSLPEPIAASAEQIAIGNILNEAIATAVAGLDDRDRTVVVEHFGLDGHPQRSLRAISRRTGISPSTVRKRLDAALGQLQTVLSNHLPQRNSAMATATKTADWSSYGFVIDLHPAWEVFPGDGTNGSIAQIRTGPGSEDLALNLWKLPNQGASTDQIAESVQGPLGAAGYGDFDVATIDAPEGFEGRRLTARRPEGWTTIQHYFTRGPATFVIGWGTTDPNSDAAIIDETTRSFRATT